MSIVREPAVAGTFYPADHAALRAQVEALLRDVPRPARAAKAIIDDTRVVVSSDLSHYLPYERAREVDRETAEAILALDADALDGDRACGHAAVAGLLEVARRRGLTAELLDLRSSGDTRGPRGEVVGYGAFGFYEGGA